jgi:hypothetical protein
LLQSELLAVCTIGSSETIGIPLLPVLLRREGERMKKFMPQGSAKQPILERELLIS